MRGWRFSNRFRVCVTSSPSQSCSFLLSSLSKYIVVEGGELSSENVASRLRCPAGWFCGEDGRRERWRKAAKEIKDAERRRNGKAGDSGWLGGLTAYRAADKEPICDIQGGLSNGPVYGIRSITRKII